MQGENSSRSSLCRGAGQIKRAAGKKKGAAWPPESLRRKVSEEVAELEDELHRELHVAAVLRAIVAQTARHRDVFGAADVGLIADEVQVRVVEDVEEFAD